MTPALVIFDCDGVLVDSETVSADVLRDMAAESGIGLDRPGAFALLHGRKVAHWVAELGELGGRPLPDGFVEEFRARTFTAFERELRPVPGVAEALAALDVPDCVASSAPMEKIRHVLALTGLLRRFDGRLHSAYEVGVWKPDPGLFLHAARAAGAAPERCVVVEDSAVGVAAGVAAGMRVLGYAPDGSGTGRQLARAGARVFTDMSRLPSLVAETTDRVPTGHAR
ncbi:HAD-IA family hydrolase [Streptomyces durbertensis]|uniref:HAD-IA family hydrolase n=1 Tax=Streptomyces durbertensis TaxID=2448886 RepID=A0ABR6EKS8_9ACTN|nr:HAD-IA family hydrolase [Streptomyces durbertensis]MBB1245943.1 HAD-IA family hydrolase [Streptomyces durbertensis]